MLIGADLEPASGLCILRSVMGAIMVAAMIVPCAACAIEMPARSRCDALGLDGLSGGLVGALCRAFRIRHVDMPATPERPWAAIVEGRRVHTL
jgi:hypothetical protein